MYNPSHINKEHPMNSNFCFNMAMRISSRLITQFYDERLSVLGLKVGQFSILRATHFAGETTNKQLQGILVIDQTTLTRNLKPLLRDAFLQVKAAAEDGRVKNIRLTKKGQALYDKALPIWEQAQKDILVKLGDKQAQNILDLTETFVDALNN